MSVATVGMTGLTFHPTILTLDFDIYFFAGFLISDQAVGSYSMPGNFHIWDVNLRKFFILKIYIDIQFVKFARLRNDFQFCVLKKLFKDVVKRMFGYHGVSAAITLPFASQSVGNASHS